MDERCEFLCTFQILVKTEEPFGLAAMIEEMRISGSVNKATNAWECDGDYIKVACLFGDDVA